MKKNIFFVQSRNSGYIKIQILNYTLIVGILLHGITYQLTFFISRAEDICAKILDIRKVIRKTWIVITFI